jgi:hypothetical protein
VGRQLATLFIQQSLEPVKSAFELPPVAGPQARLLALSVLTRMVIARAPAASGLLAIAFHLKRIPQLLQA